MNMRLDPRTLGFNYNSEWTGKNPPVYHTAVKLAYLFGRKAGELDASAHELEMAIKDVRHAKYGTERMVALADLEKEVAKHLPEWIEH